MHELVLEVTSIADLMSPDGNNNEAAAEQLRWARVEVAPDEPTVSETPVAVVVARLRVEVAGDAGCGAGRAQGPSAVIPRGVEVFVALEPIDLRWWFDHLGGPPARALHVAQWVVLGTCSRASEAHS